VEKIIGVVLVEAVVLVVEVEIVVRLRKAEDGENQPTSTITTNTIISTNLKHK
jgi:hypothetical protein